MIALLCWEGKHTSETGSTGILPMGMMSAAQQAMNCAAQEYPILYQLLTFTDLVSYLIVLHSKVRTVMFHKGIIFYKTVLITQ